MEYDYLVNTVQELRTESFFKRFHNVLNALFVFVAFGLSFGESELFRFGKRTGTEIGCQDNNRVLEIDNSSVAVGKSAVFQNLQENIENIGMSFLNFIKKDNGVRISPYLFGKLTCFVVSDISGR